ncbi:MAG: 23S rRNA (adenine(2503)-C(2))-methyltransferase RlmN [Burkholderiaceae bacterium]|nr:23S rRNA (adenine(2503)-C(2))-methyltransferase RlmN [Burkholderiaceae bacterium]
MLPFPPPPTDLLALSEGAMVEFVRERGWPTYRAAQILRWLYQGRVRSFAEMTNLAQKDREHLAASCIIGRTRTVQTFASQDGTTKFVLTLADHTNIECVLIPDDERLTLCLSSQVGCTLDCGFCLTGTLGLTRNLRPHEIVDQVLLAQDHLTAEQRITNLVFMGMGEPAHNLDNVLEAIQLLGSEGGIGHKNLVFSTVGDPRVFERLPVGRVKPALALSLHSTLPERRAQLLPRAPRIDPAELVAAAGRYAQATGYPVQYQWTLIEGVNDGDDEVEGIARLLAGQYAVMNLIPYNAVTELPWRRPSWEHAADMARRLHRRGVLTKLRQSAAQDVDGGCGQLRARTVTVSPPRFLLA